jgi:hypothetical protein
VSITTNLLNAIDVRNGMAWRGDAATPKRGRRVLWFGMIYVASVVVFAAVAGLLSFIVPD